MSDIFGVAIICLAPFLVLFGFLASRRRKKELAAIAQLIQERNRLIAEADRSFHGTEQKATRHDLAWELDPILSSRLHVFLSQPGSGLPVCRKSPVRFREVLWARSIEGEWLSQTTVLDWEQQYPDDMRDPVLVRSHRDEAGWDLPLGLRMAN